jgi:hypothetical protein
MGCGAAGAAVSASVTDTTGIGLPQVAPSANPSATSPLFGTP